MMFDSSNGVRSLESNAKLVRNGRALMRLEASGQGRYMFGRKEALVLKSAGDSEAEEKWM